MNESGDPPRRRMVRAPTRGDAQGRNVTARVKTAEHRSLSSQQWLNRQINDPYVQRAKTAGYRSRAAYKLFEIDDRFGLLRRGARVIDLGCAPGGWLQVALERGVTAVAGVDLLPVAPLPPVELIEGDFTDPAIGPRLLTHLGGPPDVILSDMAPNTIGHQRTDHLRIVTLVEAAADYAARVLRPGGAFVSKAFQGGETAEVLASLKRDFTEVRHFKPKASRSDSSEVYLVAIGLRR